MGVVLQVEIQGYSFTEVVRGGSKQGNSPVREILYICAVVNNLDFSWH